jgi:hypothetical protein
MMRSTRARKVAVLCALAPAWAGAQDTSAVQAIQAVRPVRAGDLVRLRTRQRDAHGHGYRCEGRVSAIAADTLMVSSTSRWGGCPRQLYAPGDVASLDVARGNRGSRLAHVGIGVLAGSLLAGTIAWAAIGDDCGQSNCGDDELVAVVVAFLGVVVGGTTGAVVGLALPAGPKWAPVPTDTPLRVAGLAVRPSIRWVGSR